MAARPANAPASEAFDRLRVVVPIDRQQRALADSQPAPRADATEIQGTRWRGASRTLRSLQNWVAGIGSATSDLPGHEQRTLRARSRDAARNHMPARAALMRSRTSIVGTGLVCRPSIDHEALGLTADEAAAYNTRLRAEWETWAENPLECDFEATLDFYGLQGLALLSSMASGDVLALSPMRRLPGTQCELKVQLVEADRICNPNDAGDTPNCIDGVKIEGGMPVGYWVRNIHPGDRVDMRQARWDYFPAFGAETGRRRAIMVWNDKERPGQVRGAPYLAPILEPLQQLSRFTNAELMAAVISAMFTVFIEREAEGETDENCNPLPPFEVDSSGNISMGNGAIVDLAPGEKAKEVNPARPNANFDPFFTALLKQVGATLEIPLDVLLLQFNSSYSAARAAMLEAWRFFMGRRWSLTTQFCHPWYALRIDEAVASGRLHLPGYGDPARRHAWLRSLWIGPARGSMDEEKEARAAKTRIEIGVSNEAMETAAANGEDWATVYEQRVREVNRRKADGLWSAPKAAPAAAPDREGRDETADDSDDTKGVKP